jgi:hypothetical protein
MESVRSHSPRQCVALAFAPRAAVAALAALVMACSSGSNPVGLDAGTDSGGGAHRPAPDSGSDAHADGASDGSLACTPIGYMCESFTVCCAGGTCLPAGPGGSACTGPDSGPGECLGAGQPCSSTESCCNGSGNCGEGTTNTCE